MTGDQYKTLITTTILPNDIFGKIEEMNDYFLENSYVLDKPFHNHNYNYTVIREWNTKENQQILSNMFDSFMSFILNAVSPEIIIAAMHKAVIIYNLRGVIEMTSLQNWSAISDRVFPLIKEQ